MTYKFRYILTEILVIECKKPAIVSSYQLYIYNNVIYNYKIKKPITMMFNKYILF